MVRNIVLAVSTLAALVVVFVGYVALVGLPGGGAEQDTALTELPSHDNTAEPLRIGEEGVEVPPGGRMMYRQFDERTGRPTDMISWEDWRPVAGSQREIIVSQPKLELLMPSGMIATISADEGQISGDRAEGSQMRPQQGYLSGNVRIVVDRDTGAERTPRAQRPEDLIVVTMDELEFDLELGELDTKGRVTVHSAEFEIAGTGLHLLWNQADNRVETLTIEQGEEFVLTGAAGLISATTNPEQVVSGAAAEAEPAEEQVRPRRRDARRRKATAYLCTLTGGVVAEQFQGDQLVGGLQADELRLLFDVGGGTGRTLRAAPPAAASQPADEPGERLVVRWSGPLHLGPATAEPDGGENRRQFVALGSPLVMVRDQSEVRCGKVEYHDETQRIWLEPLPGDVVEFGLGKNLSAIAAGVYVDRDAGIVKLIGDVELRSRRGTEAAARSSSIRCAYWAELHIAAGRATTQPAAGPVLESNRIESATFVGNVEVDLGPQTLYAHRFDVAFRPGGDEQTLEELLDTATASGDVRLTGNDDGALECAQLDIAFGLTASGDLYPRQLNARGAVRVARKRSSISGDQVLATLAPPPDPNDPAAPSLVLRTLEVIGRAELIDRDSKVAARGQRIEALFEGVNVLRSAAVSGTADTRALVHAHPYTVRGGRVDLDFTAETVRVDGPSRLSFKTRRSLQGVRRRDPTAVVVSSSRALRIDGQRNTVRFVGDVAAASGEEQLQASTLTLLLEDVPEPPQPSRPWKELWRQVRGLAAGRTTEAKRDDPLALRLDDEDRRLRKEPKRLVAGNALVTSEAYEAGREHPITHASISAPLLEVDIANRQIFTSGRTQLLLIDRQRRDSADRTRAALGAPAALMSDGASQTAMQCDGGMTYKLGAEGPDRRDTALFQDAVVFVHRSGREMANLEHMLSQVSLNPDLLEPEKSRNAMLNCDRLECWFGAAEVPGSVRRGGGLASGPLRLVSLIASGSVFLHDKEDTRTREVNAEWVEFSRAEGRLDVRGPEGGAARVYLTDTATQGISYHHGERMLVNLKDGSVQAIDMRGQVSR